MTIERLQKVLAASGVASRRASEVLIATGRVTVDGKVAAIGAKVDPEKSIIAVDGRVIGGAAPAAYLLLNKPAGVTSTVRDRHASRTVLEMLPTALVPEGARLYPVGRLDQDSEGLLVLTNDGAWADRVLHPRHGIEREYAIGLRAPLSADQVAALQAGIQLDEGLATLSGLRATTETETRLLVEQMAPPPGNLLWYRAILAQGWRRQLRRMFGPSRRRSSDLSGSGSGQSASRDCRAVGLGACGRPRSVASVPAPGRAGPGPGRARAGTRRPAGPGHHRPAAPDSRVAAPSVRFDAMDRHGRGGILRRPASRRERAAHVLERARCCPERDRLTGILTGWFASWSPSMARARRARAASEPPRRSRSATGSATPACSTGRSPGSRSFALSRRRMRKACAPSPPTCSWRPMAWAGSPVSSSMASTARPTCTRPRSMPQCRPSRPCRSSARRSWNGSARLPQEAASSWPGGTSARSCCPDADLKIFLDASVEERARRRAEERGLDPHGPEADAILAALRRRDELDSTRAVAPLFPAPDARIIATDGNRFEDTVDAVVGAILDAEARRAAELAAGQQHR